jgi:hypothetical protein
MLARAGVRQASAMTLHEEELKKLGYKLVSEVMPSPDQPVFVVTPRDRCLALFTVDRKWISQDAREELTDVIGWAPWPQEGQ